MTQQECQWGLVANYVQIQLPPLAEVVTDNASSAISSRSTAQTGQLDVSTVAAGCNQTRAQDRGFEG